MAIRLEALMGQETAARLLGVAPATLERWRWAGRGPRYRKLGRCVRYALEDLEAFVAASARTSTSDPGSGSPAAP
jgi:predicted site-specific integrase-resolvase